MAPAIAKELHLSPAQMGLVFSAFGIAYAGCEIPSGWLCDRFGARRLLTRVVLLWSIFTAATGIVWSFPSLVVTRLLFGAGESGCFPGLARVFRTWLPREERNSAEGIKAAAARWGAALTPPLIVALYAWLNWRQIFMLFGAAGILWAVAFHRLYRDEPVMDARPSAPWTAILGSRRVWALGIQWFCHYYGFYFYITWLPLYLYQARGLDLRHESLAAALPLFSAGAGSLFAGWALTQITRRIGSTARARQLLGYAAYGGAALLLLLFTFIAHPGLAIVVLSLSSFAAEFSGPISWTAAMDIGGERVGAVSGFMNTLGQCGAAVAPAVTGFLLAWTGNAWNIAFHCSALIYAAGAVCWVFIDSTTPLSSHPAPGGSDTIPAEMPIYEYRCHRCANEFELLLLPASPAPACPSCESREIEQLLSGFAVSSEGIRENHLQKARRKHASSAQVRDEKVAEAEYFQKEKEEHGGV
jgi:putative FmdB family regulatory protein